MVGPKHGPAAAAAQERAATRNAARAEGTSSGNGSPAGRCLSLAARRTVEAHSASPRMPIRVSVGATTRSPRRSAATAA